MEQYLSEQTVKKYMENMMTVIRENGNLLRETNASVNRIESKVDVLTEQIANYKALLEHQIDLAVSDDEIERIIHSYSDICTGQIIKSIENNDASAVYDLERIHLVELFGQDAWGKLDEASQTFLISSKVMYNKLKAVGNAIDFSGVCLLVTKALEVEMKNRFGKAYLLYAQQKFGMNYAQYPTGLIKKDGFGNLQPIREQDFTFGTVAYVLCYKTEKHETQITSRNNKQCLLEFSKATYFPTMSENDIALLLKQYATEIERIRKDYRNPTAHTEQISIIKAKECMDLVIDVEKLLKRMLDSFAK